MTGRSHFRTRTGAAFALLLLVMGLLSPAARASDTGSLDTQKLQAVTVVTQNGNQTFTAEFANTPTQRARGLMFKTRLPERQGMLFDFGRDQKIRMWMKNTLIPLSVAFIDEGGTIINIADMQPHSEQSHCASTPAVFALEMTKGWFAQRGVKAGTKLGGLEKPAPQR